MKKRVSHLIISAALLTGSSSLYAGTSTEQEIEHLLNVIANSGCTFIRNGSEYPAIDAKSHIVRKYEYVKSHIKTTEDFILLAASQSSFSGTPYHIKCAGTDSLSKDWLSNELIRFRQPNSLSP